MRRRKPEDRILDVLTASGCAPVALSEKDLWSWQNRWRAVFAKELHAATGTWTFTGFDWHVFSFEHHASTVSDAAWDAYRRVRRGAFLVLSAECSQSFGFACKGKPPDGLNARIDIVVAPTTLKWTMAFTHESECGPYFAEP